MSKTRPPVQQPSNKPARPPKPRQLKIRQLQELMQSQSPQPESWPEVPMYKPLG